MFTGHNRTKQKWKEKPYKVLEVSGNVLDKEVNDWTY